MAVQERTPILPQTETILNHLDKQQIRTFRLLAKGSDLNALVDDIGLEPMTFRTSSSVIKICRKCPHRTERGHLSCRKQLFA